MGEEIDELMDDDDDDSDGDDDKAKSNAALIGIAVGCVLAALAVIFVIAVLIYKKM